MVSIITNWSLGIGSITPKFCMIKKILKNKPLLILTIIVIFLIAIRLFSKSSSKKDIQNQTSSTSNSSLSTPTPSPNLTPYPQIDEIIDLNRQIPLARLLPYKGKYFQVKRYSKANNLELIVFDKSKTDLAKQEAQDWLIENGVDTLDRFTVVY